MSWGVQIRNATVSWGNSFNLVVGGLKLESNQISGRLPVLGRSGSGKSTLLYLLTFLKRPTEGTVRWSFPDGHRAVWGPKGLDSQESTLDLTQIRRQCFGFAYQNSTLTPYLRVRENLRYPLELLGGFTKSEMDRRVHAAMDRVLLRDDLGARVEDTSPEEFLDRYPNELSGGQFQRVALAQAMIHDPHVLFADEPTGNLDADTRQEVMGLVDRWLAKGDRMVIWVTHHRSDAIDPRVSHWLMVANNRCLLRLKGGKKSSNNESDNSSTAVG
ncbi:ABC transporter ATP-binding protein [Candidatus Magnetaquicoccus inordinatus]|uniref:ABC transporter ATP-binding protein n=1 Tax=Candidatus Magnetaquicoccus inordinatus TaxID=2496818 RepID=UPI00102C3B87|nr:ATP-binding cassette domain-containing protein [Candidatus Magnetaquicoccus inordinatus]